MSENKLPTVGQRMFLNTARPDTKVILGIVTRVTVNDDGSTLIQGKELSRGHETHEDAEAWSLINPDLEPTKGAVPWSMMFAKAL